MTTVSLPPEVWCHILSYLSKNDIDAVIATKRLNRLSYNELKDRDPQLLVQDVNWATLRGTIKYLSHRKIFTATSEQVSEFWRSGEVNDILRNAENAVDKPDRYFTFKVLLLSAPEAEKEGIYRTYRQLSGDIYSGTQYFTKLTSDDEIQTKTWLWDVESSSTFDQIPPVYLNFANSLLMTFCVNSRGSFKLLIDGCIRIISEFYSRKSTMPPLLYLVGVVSSKKNKRFVTWPEIELITKSFNLKYFEILDFSSVEITNMMDTVRSDMQKAAAGKYFAQKQGFDIMQGADPNRTPKKWCSIM